MRSSPPATLDGLPGRGYAVVESLPSLGKGRSCTGVFAAEAEHGEALRALVGGRRVAWTGVVHSRHRSAEATLDVAVVRVVDGEGPVGRDGLTVEFTAPVVPYDVAG